MCIYKNRKSKSPFAVPLHKMWSAWLTRSLLRHLQEQDVYPVNRPAQNAKFCLKHHIHFYFLKSIHSIKKNTTELYPTQTYEQSASEPTCIMWENYQSLLIPFKCLWRRTASFVKSKIIMQWGLCLGFFGVFLKK